MGNYSRHSVSGGFRRGLLSNPSAAVLEDDNEKIWMAEIWATVKNRDGKPRYEMMKT